MERPVPGEAMPDGWRSIEWMAFLMLDSGETLRATAKAVDRKPQTVQSWVKKWRNRWGDDILVSARKPSENLQDPEHQRAAARAGAEQAIESHRNNRAAMALSAGVTADFARSLGLKAMQNIAASPVALAELTARDVLYLARAFEMFSRRADQLGDIPSIDRAVAMRATVNGEGASLEAGVDLSALDRAAAGDGYTEALALADVVWEEFRAEVVEERGEVIDVDEAEGGSE